MPKVYEDNAEAFHKQRDKSLFEKAWLDKFLKHVDGEVLDIGCGSGDPITRYLIIEGYKVTGVDQSNSMIGIAKKNFPKNEWLVGDMRQISLDKKFSGIIAWNSFFHLTNSDQKMAFKKFLYHLLPEGVLMFTAGPSNGEVLGRVNGFDVYHSSMSSDEYKTELEKLGMQIIDYKLEDSSCNMHSVYLAKRMT